ncbi:DUF4136 domain-containing protein [Gramella lutea]|uniref:DUF4136 domain-containing protein n=1 Tax=Christiangramia lutea TaxID=1607951 RepID=A0A9X2A9U2_9FLAO|nr:DUF4136 domain-containing protein [Christiangramia lutea]MCH4823944.1 DUF4136 domain-containing protein [Christiangramia lutea]
MKIFKFSILILFIAACNAPQAVYDYDQEVNFDQYSTYQLFPDFRTGLSQLDESRLTESLVSALPQKGFSKGDADPDIYVNVYTEQYQQDNRSRVGVGFGGGGGNVGVGVSGGIPVGQMDTYLRLTFDFIDVEKDILVWQAVVESPFKFDADPKSKQEQFNKIVAEAMEGYPPKK